MLLVTTALTGLMAGVIQTAPTPPQQPQTPPTSTRPPATTTAADDEAYDLGTVSVVGQRPRGSVNTDIPADVTLSAEQIQAYGASNIAELMTYLEPLTRSSSGRTDLQPVFLVNGRRISGFQEIQGIPTEAIERTDILPEQVALQFGYRAEQRVVNFVLKANFNSITGELSGRGPTQGGRTTAEIEGNVLRISGSNRWSMDAEYERSTPLFESERDLNRSAGATPYDLIGNVTIPGYTAACATTPNTCAVIDPALGTAVTPVPGGIVNPTLADFVSAAGGGMRTGDLGAYRTLLSESDRATVRGTMKRDLNGTTQMTVSGSLEDTSSRSFNGLPGVTLNLPETNGFSPFSNDVLVHRYIDDAASLRRETDSLNGKLGVVIDGFLGEAWRWTATGSYERTETDTTTGRGYDTPLAFQTRINANDPSANPFNELRPVDFTRNPNDTANSVSQLLSAEVVLNGDLYALPAGSISSTFKFGADTRSLDSTSTRQGVTTDRSESRDRFNGQGTFNMPIASRRRDALSACSATCRSMQPSAMKICPTSAACPPSASASTGRPSSRSPSSSATPTSRARPSIGQLNDPIIRNFNVPVFDFRTGSTVLVTQTTGGNPDLNADNRHVWRSAAPGGRSPVQRPVDPVHLDLQPHRRLPSSSFPTITPTSKPPCPAASSARERRADRDRLPPAELRPDTSVRTSAPGVNYSRAFGTPNPVAANQSPLPGMPGGGASAGRRRHEDPHGRRWRWRWRLAAAVPRCAWAAAAVAAAAGMQPGQGRFNMSVYHTIRLQDEITIADGLPVIDLLDGGATSAAAAARATSCSWSRPACSATASAASSTPTGATAPSSTAAPARTSILADQTTVNLNVFMDLNQRTSWVAKYPMA
jgi:hypothetical protein